MIKILNIVNKFVYLGDLAKKIKKDVTMFKELDLMNLIIPNIVNKFVILILVLKKILCEKWKNIITTNKLPLKFLKKDSEEDSNDFFDR